MSKDCHLCSICKCVRPFLNSLLILELQEVLKGSSVRSHIDENSL